MATPSYSSKKRKTQTARDMAAEIDASRRETAALLGEIRMAKNRQRAVLIMVKEQMAMIDKANDTKRKLAQKMAELSMVNAWLNGQNLVPEAELNRLLPQEDLVECEVEDFHIPEIDWDSLGFSFTKK